MHRLSDEERMKTKENSISTLKSVRVRLQESVRLQERENTESNWEA